MSTVHTDHSLLDFWATECQGGTEKVEDLSQFSVRIHRKPGRLNRFFNRKENYKSIWTF